MNPRHEVGQTTTDGPESPRQRKYGGVKMFEVEGYAKTFNFNKESINQPLTFQRVCVECGHQVCCREDLTCRENMRYEPGHHLSRSHLVRTDSSEKTLLRCRVLPPPPPRLPRPEALPNSPLAAPPLRASFPVLSVDEACETEAPLSSKEDSSKIKSIVFVAAPDIGGKDEHADRFSSSSTDGEAGSCSSGGGIDDDAGFRSSSSNSAGVLPPSTLPPPPPNAARTAASPRPCCRNRAVLLNSRPKAMPTPFLPAAATPALPASILFRMCMPSAREPPEAFFGSPALWGFVVSM